MAKAGKVSFNQLMDYRKQGRLKWVGSQILQEERRGEIGFMIFILEQIKPRQHKKFVVMRNPVNAPTGTTFWVSEAAFPENSDPQELERLHTAL